MIKKNFEDFNWEKYEHWAGTGLHSNPKVKGQTNKNKCFCHEPYAQDMFNLFDNENLKFIRKDLEMGDIVPIVEIYFINDSGKIMVEILGGLTIEVDLGREKKFIQLYGFNTVDEFMGALDTKEKKQKFVEQGLYAYVVESSPNAKISLWQGYISKIKEEFMDQIGSPTKAYVAKIMEANRGGFFVEVQGVDAFMPGSLAAANKIVNFESYVGKEVIVMVEDFLKDMNSFIVSHKKYIEHILPQKISELSMDQKYSGLITGTSKYGIFAEFDELFTGLLHKSKMKEDTLNKFRNREYNPGDPIEFYISEVSKDNRIILTEESPEEKKAKIEEFVKKYDEKPVEAEIAAIMNFGVIVNVEDLSGVVQNKEFRKVHTSSKNFIVGDKIKLKLLEIKDGDKLSFTFWGEFKEKEEGA
jgi:predicted RNA-binding protein with RPS1 domain